MRLRVTLVFAAAVVVAGLAALIATRLLFGRPTVQARPNILLITLDTTRADHLGAYGDRAARTPRIDRLASEGVLFEQAMSAAPITLPAHVSLLTGRYPFAHGVRNNGNFKLDTDVATLATLLHERGYRTAAFVSAFVLDRRSGLSRGFDVYDDHLDASSGDATDGELERRGDRTALAARNWLKERGSSPFFVWIHLYDPHDPYNPPPPFDELFRDRPYDGEIAFDDRVIGSILDDLEGLGALSSTVVALVGDHGESLGEHDEATHALFVYQSTLRVPMILRWPGHLGPTHVPALVRAIDLTPTLLDLVGQAALREAHGESLLPLVTGHGGAPTSAYSETYFPLFFMNWAPLRSFRDDRWKLIDAPTPELYDLNTDPRETVNLAEREPRRTAALQRALSTISSRGARTMAPIEPDRETVEKLAALGYVGVGNASRSNVPETSEARPDPKAMIGVFNHLREANRLVSQAGRAGEAEKIVRGVLKQDPQNAFATSILAKAEMRQDRCREAIATYRAYAALVPTSADAHYGIALCAAQLGERNHALDEAGAALALDALDVPARVLHAGLLTESGRLDDAQSEYRRAIELQPSNADAHSGYGVLLMARAEPDRAIQELHYALELRPALDDARLALGGILTQVGRVAEARAEYQELEARPGVSPQIRTVARDRLARLARLSK